MLTHDLLLTKNVEGHGNGAGHAVVEKNTSIVRVEGPSGARYGGNFELESTKTRLDEVQSRNQVLETRCRDLSQRSSQLEGRRG